jgi:hypothetical protein
MCAHPMSGTNEAEDSAKFNPGLGLGVPPPSDESDRLTLRCPGDTTLMTGSGESPFLQDAQQATESDQLARDYALRSPPAKLGSCAHVRTLEDQHLGPGFIDH